MLCNVITTYLTPTFWCTGLVVEGTAHCSNSHRRSCIAIHLQQRHLLGMWVNYLYNIQGGHIRHARDDTSRWHQQSAHCEQIKDLVLVLRMRFCIYLYRLVATSCQRWVANSVPGQMDNSHSSQATNSIPRHMDYSLHMGTWTHGLCPSYTCNQLPSKMSNQFPPKTHGLFPLRIGKQLPLKLGNQFPPIIHVLFPARAGNQFLPKTHGLFPP